MFDKEIMIDYMDEKDPKLKSKYACYTIDTCNVVELLERFSKTSFLDIFQPIGVFVRYWHCSHYRRMFHKYVFEQELSIQQHEFNLFPGMTMKLDTTTGFDYNKECTTISITCSTMFLQKQSSML